MAEPRVPGGRDTELDLPCGETVDVRELDLGLREIDCACGASHAVVMDPHPLGRFVPEFLVDVLRATVDTADEFDEFTTAHLMGIVREEFPDAVASADVAEDGQVGFALVWVTDFDARRLHEIVVELVVELMEHAVGHADDDGALAEFEQQMHQFDVEAFVEQYRRERDFESEFDSAA
ncbi:hypothetical protein BRC83_04970 [Halobacteriales archaeon QS_1_68_17]|nr:MAG: hypothetical protein BRC83_04970 [Halobacteriales archaeon QS_1_68_17]